MCVCVCVCGGGGGGSSERLRFLSIVVVFCQGGGVSLGFVDFIVFSGFALLDGESCSFSLSAATKSVLPDSSSGL